MGTTAKYAIPFPAGTDPPAGAPQMQALAEKVDSSLFTVASTIQPGVQSFTQAQIDALTPAQKTNGMIVWNSTKYWHQAWNSASWEYVNDVPRMTTAERDILQPKQLGTVIWNTSTTRLEVWNSLAWNPVGGGLVMAGMVADTGQLPQPGALPKYPTWQEQGRVTFQGLAGHRYATTGYITFSTGSTSDTANVQVIDNANPTVNAIGPSCSMFAFNYAAAPLDASFACGPTDRSITLIARACANTAAGTGAKMEGARLMAWDLGLEGSAVSGNTIVPTNVWNTAWGTLPGGLDQLQRDVGPIGATPVDLFKPGGLNVPVVAGRRYKISSQWTGFAISVANDQFMVSTIVDGASLIAPWLQIQGNQSDQSVVYHDASTTKTINVNVRASRVSGTGTASFITVGFSIEDVGPTAPAAPDTWTPNPMPGPWLPLPYGSGWSGAASFPPGAYRKVGDEVQLRGIVTGPAANYTIATLPAGYRPPSLAAPNGPIFGVWVYGQTSPTCRIDISPAGVVLLQGGLTGTITYLSLDQIRFSTVAA